ncbi:MAG TPA: hypothetical protein DER23_07215 [Clostridiales bacterium]|jgi:NAD(P) transhydrogenase subunit beta|nr:hypothetical protein [Clostridiales bacterium]
MTQTIYYLICGIVTAGILTGIVLMSRPNTARHGNGISALCSLVAVLASMWYFNILDNVTLWVCVALGSALGIWGTYKVKTIQMPQAVALLNGLGGASSMLTAMVLIMEGEPKTTFSLVTAGIALFVGAVTLFGSLVAAGKLHKWLPQRPVVLPHHQFYALLSLFLSIAFMILLPFMSSAWWGIFVCSLAFSVIFTIRVGGADMPITISLLNSLSGVAGGIAGITIGNPLLTAAGGIVGASGLILTQIMCKAMNRKLADILFTQKRSVNMATSVKNPEPVSNKGSRAPMDLTLRGANNIIIIPGYGMALAQAQEKVKELSHCLEEKGATVRFAIHPVAGRMPGHMNVLLCEVDIPYDQLYELEAINDDFASCDAVVVVGANDVLNPAANTAEGTPIYGMPVFNAMAAPKIVICNYDTKPGYAGVENPLYQGLPHVRLLLGDAKDSLDILLQELKEN